MHSPHPRLPVAEIYAIGSLNLFAAAPEFSMSRTNAVLFALVAVLAVGLYSVSTRPVATGITTADVQAIVDKSLAAKPATDVAAVTAIVTDLLAKREADALPQSAAQIDAATLNPMIEDYLMGNPRILQRVSDALDTEIKTAELAQRKDALQSMQAVIYDDPDHIVLGNPEGDVTLVELFDYNCGYCRSALPDLATLMAEDPNLKVILKEFPILSQGSIDAAKVAVLVGRSDVDYWAFHQKLFTSRGQVTKETALAAAQSLGLNPINIGLEMEGADVNAAIETSYDIAKALNVSGTPTYIIGDEVIPGAIGLDALRERISNMRKCGSTVCPA
jgi:protein-disulfide isomerase